MTTIVTIKDQPFVLLPKHEYDELLAEARGMKLPQLPAADKRGYRPAREYIRASVAREIITRRLAAGWIQEELAKQARVSAETVSRLENASHKPQAATVERIEEAFKKVGV